MRTDRSETFCSHSRTGTTVPLRAFVTRSSAYCGHALRAFTLSEMLIVMAIFAVIVAVTAPSLTTVARDIQTKRAMSDVTAGLMAARSRAIRDRTIVALHVFRDSAVYRVQTTAPVFNGRWGYVWDTAAGAPVPLDHVATNKMVMRLEIPNPHHNPTPGAPLSFMWPGDHDPIVLPDSLGLCRPDTVLYDAADTSAAAKDGQYVDVSVDLGAAPGTYKLPLCEDFYIVFAEEGKIATVLVDYNVMPSSSAQTVVSSDNNANVGSTWSAMGLCMYDMARFKNPPQPENYDRNLADRDRYTYVNSPDNRIMISPFTGMALTMETSR